MALAVSEQLPQRAKDHLAGEVLTVPEIAARLKISTRTVIRNLEKGNLPGKKIGSKWRCRADALEAFLS